MPQTVISGSDDTEGNDIEESKENQNGASSNNNPRQRHRVESQGNCLTNSVVQGSGTSASRGSRSEIPQSFPTTTENTSSDGNSLQSKQLKPQPVSEQIPAEEKRASVSDKSALGDDQSSRESAPDDQICQIIDSPCKTIATGQQIRPAPLTHNPCHDDEEERSDSDEGGKMTCAFPLDFTVYVQVTFFSFLFNIQ